MKYEDFLDRVYGNNNYKQDNNNVISQNARNKFYNKVYIYVL